MKPGGTGKMRQTQCTSVVGKGGQSPESLIGQTCAFAISIDTSPNITDDPTMDGRVIWGDVGLEFHTFEEGKRASQEDGGKTVPMIGFHKGGRASKTVLRLL
jgi:hypothetical protein